MKATLSGLLGVILTTPLLCAAGDPQAANPRDANAGASTGEPAGRSEDEKAIRAATEAIAQNFLKGDAKAVAGGFTPDGEAIDAEGGAIQGRAALEEHYAARFATSPGDKLAT